MVDTNSNSCSMASQSLLMDQALRNTGLQRITAHLEVEHQHIEPNKHRVPCNVSVLAVYLYRCLHAEVHTQVHRVAAACLGD